jgi:hypothetical protein
MKWEKIANKLQMDLVQTKKARVLNTLFGGFGECFYLRIYKKYNFGVVQNNQNKSCKLNLKFV